jgi:multiple sugar transport system permease protein
VRFAAAGGQGGGAWTLPGNGSAMVDLARQYPGGLAGPAARPRTSMRRFLRRRSTTAVLMCLPLIAIVTGLIVYPALYSIYLAMLNKAQTKFIGLGNFAYLLQRDTFWMVVQQSAIFALSAVFFKALIGLITAHLVNNLPSKGQRKWRGMLLVPWVIPLALSTLGWWWLFDPTHSAFNWIIQSLGGNEIPWLSNPYWARFSVILVNVWYGAPFFLIMYLAALKSVPEQLYEAAQIDGANAWQRFLHITLPMMRNIIAITVLFSLIVTFANFDIVQIMTAGGPRNMTHVFATYAFLLGIRSGDLPLGASVSLFMFPILAISAMFILRGVRKRGREIG